MIFKKIKKKKNARIFSKITLIAHLRIFGAWFKKKEKKIGPAIAPKAFVSLRFDQHQLIMLK